MTINDSIAVTSTERTNVTVSASVSSLFSVALLPHTPLLAHLTGAHTALVAKMTSLLPGVAMPDLDSPIIVKWGKSVKSLARFAGYRCHSNPRDSSSHCADATGDDATQLLSQILSSSSGADLKATVEAICHSYHIPSPLGATSLANSSAAASAIPASVAASSFIHPSIAASSRPLADTHMAAGAAVAVGAVLGLLDAAVAVHGGFDAMQQTSHIARHGGNCQDEAAATANSDKAAESTSKYSRFIATSLPHLHSTLALTTPPAFQLSRQDSPTPPRPSKTPTKPISNKRHFSWNYP